MMFKLKRQNDTIWTYTGITDSHGFLWKNKVKNAEQDLNLT